MANASNAEVLQGKPRPWRILGTLIALAVVIAFGLPFAKDAYHWWVVKQHLASVMNSTERAEFQNWQGDAASFAKTLYDRCQLTNGRNAVQCERYRYAFE